MNIKAEPGESRFSFVKRAIEYAQKNETSCMVEHNGLQCMVYPESYVFDICEKFSYIQEYTRLNKK